jgi:hypothetical protein
MPSAEVRNVALPRPSLLPQAQKIPSAGAHATSRLVLIVVPGSRAVHAGVTVRQTTSTCTFVTWNVSVWPGLRTLVPWSRIDQPKDCAYSCARVMCDAYSSESEPDPVGLNVADPLAPPKKPGSLVPLTDTCQSKPNVAETISTPAGTVMPSSKRTPSTSRPTEPAAFTALMVVLPPPFMEAGHAATSASKSW